MTTLKDLKAGDTAWLAAEDSFGQALRYVQSGPVTITRVGREYLHVDGHGRFSRTDGRSGAIHGSGTLYLSAEHYRTESDRRQTWTAFRSWVRDAYRVPDLDQEELLAIGRKLGAW